MITIIFFIYIILIIMIIISFILLFETDNRLYTLIWDHHTYKDYKYLLKKISELKVTVNNSEITELKCENVLIHIYEDFIYINVNGNCLTEFNKYYWDKTIHELNKKLQEIT